MNIAIIIILIAILGCAFLGFKLFFNNPTPSSSKLVSETKKPVITQEVKNIITNEEETIIINQPSPDLIIENPIDLSEKTLKSNPVINTEEEIKPENMVINNSVDDIQVMEHSSIIQEQNINNDNSSNSILFDNINQIIENSNTNSKHISNTNFNPFNV